MNLNVSSLFFELALIFLPGFIWMKIHTNYGAKGEPSQFDMILNSFIFGVLSYAILYLIYSMRGATLEIFNIDGSNTRLIQPQILSEILYAMIIALIGGIIFIYIENFKLVTQLLQKIGATKRFGDEDVWDFVFNSSSSGVDYIYFRDFEQKVVYAGYVRLFSESGGIRELVLLGVTVYDFEGLEMYQMPRLYLARERDNIHIEFPLDAKEANNES